jgi:hypothetical protein
VHKDERPRIQYENGSPKSSREKVHHTPIGALGTFKERVSLKVVRASRSTVARRTLLTVDMIDGACLYKAPLTRLDVDGRLACVASIGNDADGG